MKEIRYKKRIRHIDVGGYTEFKCGKLMIRLADAIEYVRHFGKKRYKVTREWRDVEPDYHLFYRCKNIQTVKKLLTNQNK